MLTTIDRVALARSSALALLAAVLVSASPLAALDLTGGPAVSPPGGGGCTSSGQLGSAAGVTLDCTVTSPGNFVDLYFGLVNNASANGMAMDGNGPSSFEVLRYASSTPQSITYVSSTSVADAGATEGVSTRVVLTLTSGRGTVIATGGDPADGANGDIGQLFRIEDAAFAVHIDVESNALISPAFGPSNTGLYDSARTNANTRSVTRLDVGFYYNECTP